MDDKIAKYSAMAIDDVCVTIIESRMKGMNSILEFLEFRVLNWLWNILRTKTNLRLLPRGGRVILNLRGG